MRSALYECAVLHERTGPREHRFEYRVFMFGIDVDEIDTVAEKIAVVSRNRWNLYSFRDGDHIDFGCGDVRANVTELLRRNGIAEEPGRITLVTNLRVAGYVFNPVSFFFVEDASGSPLAAVAEVNNTFGETKPYVVGREAWTGKVFDSRHRKDFYISPFIAVDGELHLRVAAPNGRIGAVIDSYERGSRTLRATLTGVRRELTTARLLWFSVIYPLMTVKVIAAIHWEALRLFLKRIPFYRKSERVELQRGLHVRLAARRANS